MTGLDAGLIAIIDNNEAARDSLRDLIEAGGFKARCFGSAKVFLDSDLYGKPAILIVEVRMPKMSGLELQARLKERQCNVPIIFIAAFDDAATRTQAMDAGAVAFLVQPFDHQVLFKTLRDASRSDKEGKTFPPS